MPVPVSSFVTAVAAILYYSCNLVPGVSHLTSLVLKGPPCLNKDDFTLLYHLGRARRDPGSKIRDPGNEVATVVSLFELLKNSMLNPLTPVPPVTGCDVPWPFFHF